MNDIYKGIQVILYISSIKSSTMNIFYTWNIKRRKEKTYKWNSNNYLVIFYLLDRFIFMFFYMTYNINFISLFVIIDIPWNLWNKRISQPQWDEIFTPVVPSFLMSYIGQSPLKIESVWLNELQICFQGPVDIFFVFVICFLFKKF